MTYRSKKIVSLVFRDIFLGNNALLVVKLVLPIAGLSVVVSDVVVACVPVKMASCPAVLVVLGVVARLDDTRLADG